MYNLTKKEKLDFILKTVADLELTAYDIGKKTKLSVSGVEKILNKTVKNPQENTIDRMLLFLETKVLGSNLSTDKNKLEEPQEKYNIQIMEEVQKNPLVVCLTEKNELTLEVVRLQNLLREHNIDFKNIFEKEN